MPPRPLVIAAAVFLACGFAKAQDDGYAGVADLTKLLRSNAFALADDYEAILTLKLGHKDINHPEIHRVRYNSFIYDGSGFSEPDNPAPSLSAIFQDSPLGGITEIAFVDPRAPRLVSKLQNIDSWEKFRKQFPHASSMTTEADSPDDPETYRYQWLHLGLNGSLTVHWIEVEHTPTSFKLWKWSGALVKAKNGAEQGGAEQPATAPELKPQGSVKPNPESEGRSR